MPGASRSAALIALAFIAACRSSRVEQAASSQVAMGSAANSGAMAAASAPEPSPRASDARWLAARDEDPAERTRLAAAVGAMGLLEGVDDGGEIERTALAALPEADDAEAALGRLGQIAAAAPPPRLGRVLEAMLQIAGRPRRQREPVDPEGARAAGEALLAIATRNSLARGDRALAISAARALAEKGWLDPRRIPGDLDPPEAVVASPP